MRQTLHARSLLVFDTWKVVAFRLAFFVYLFVLFQKSSRDLGSGWVYANVWVQYGLRANLVLQYLASVTQLLCCSSPWE